MQHAMRIRGDLCAQLVARLRELHVVFHDSVVWTEILRFGGAQHSMPIQGRARFNFMVISPVNVSK